MYILDDVMYIFDDAEYILDDVENRLHLHLKMNSSLRNKGIIRITSHLGQSLFQIINDIIDIFGTDTQAHRGRRDMLPGQLFRSHL